MIARTHNLAVVFALWLLLAATLPAAAAGNLRDPATAMSLIDYVAAEYDSSVRGGQILDQGEYAEQVEFSTRVADMVREFPAHPQRGALSRQADELAAAVAARAPGTTIGRQADQLRRGIVVAYQVVVSPSRPPEPERARQLFAKRCASCHGAEGRGDGAAASGLSPRPTNFHDLERHGRRSVQGLYATLTRGVEGTSMAGFADIPEADRWNLAFLVARLPYTAESLARGAELWSSRRFEEIFPDMDALAMATPDAVRIREGEPGALVLAYLRSVPSALQSRPALAPLAHARQALDRSLEAYRAGDARKAFDQAMSAYLEGVELAEPAIDRADAEARPQLESAMLSMRKLIQASAPAEQVAAQHGQILSALDRVEGLLKTRASDESGSQFLAALVVILREGLEAILVLASMGAVLRRTGRPEGLRWLHAGWVAALVCGGATWWVASHLIAISGAQREVTEGVTALLASAMLLYVGFWLHSRAHGQRWQAYVRAQVGSALERGTLWGLAIMAFLAVYREVFETVLFVQALLAQGSAGAVAGGLAAGVMALAVLAMAVLRFAARLPLKWVFGVSSGLLAAMAVVFAGRGIAALQEAGRLPASELDLPSVAWLGIHPTVQGLGLQAALLALIAAILLRPGVQRGPAAP